MNKKKFILFNIFKFIIPFLVILGIGAISFFASNQFTNNNYISNNKNSEQEWIEDELLNRQILIKFKYSYYSNQLLITKNKYFNAFIIEKNKVLFPIDILEYGIILNNDINNILEYQWVRLFYSFIKDSNNKNVDNNTIWHNFSIFNLNLNINLKNTIKLNNKIYLSNNNQNCCYVICDTNIDLNYQMTKLQLNYYKRIDQNDYPYWYSTIYIKDNIITYSLDKNNPFFISNSQQNYVTKYLPISIYYPKINENICILIKNKIVEAFEFKTNYFIRNIGSTNSLIIDKIGNIIATQLSSSNNINKPLFININQLKEEVRNV